MNNSSEAVFALLKGVDTPRALGLWLRFKHLGFREAVTVTFKPSDYADHVSFHKDYLALSFLKKWKAFKQPACRETALADFITSEDKCRRTNEFLRALRSGRCFCIDPTFEAFYSRMRRFIASVVGPDCYPALRHSKWTTGANDDLKKSQSYPDKKLEAPISVTRSASGYLLREIQFDPHWFYALTGVLPEGPYSPLRTIVKIVEGGRYDTVGKTSLTDRSIVVEPRGNSLLQKSVGTFLRRRLLSRGVDLNDQTINQRLASQAYRSSLATIDLKAASDTVSSELVRDLFPPDFYNMLDDLRSKSIKIDGSWTKLEKFSSMGNGFTFELESLIFKAAAYATAEMYEPGSVSSVYGDDIIVSSAVAQKLIGYLSLIGFTVNTEKSYLEGMFFESCGKHYFGDFDVTPIYQKEELDEIEAIRSFNRGYRLRVRAPYLSDAVTGFMSHLLRLYRSFAPNTFVPDWYESDDAILTDPDSLEFDRNYGYRCRRVVQNRRVLPGHHASMYAYSLRQPLAEQEATYGDVRSKKGSYALASFYMNKFG